MLVSQDSWPPPECVRFAQQANLRRYSVNTLNLCFSCMHVCMHVPVADAKLGTGYVTCERGHDICAQLGNHSHLLQEVLQGAGPTRWVPFCACPPCQTSCSSFKTISIPWVCNHSFQHTLTEVAAVHRPAGVFVYSMLPIVDELLCHVHGTYVAQKLINVCSKQVRRTVQREHAVDWMEL
jgi:hypothetical protein